MNIQDALLRGLVPAGRPDAGVPARPLTEADFARSYVGYSDLFGVQPTWATFFERLQDLGLQPTMAALSFLNSWLYLKGGIQAQAMRTAASWLTTCFASSCTPPSSDEPIRYWYRNPTNARPETPATMPL